MRTHPAAYRTQSWEASGTLSWAECISSIGHPGLVVHPFDQFIAGNDHTLTDTDGGEGLTLSQFVDLGLGDSQYGRSFVRLEGQGQIFDVGVCRFQTVSSLGFELMCRLQNKTAFGKHS